MSQICLPHPLAVATRGSGAEEDDRSSGMNLQEIMCTMQIRTMCLSPWRGGIYRVGLSMLASSGVRSVAGAGA